MKEFLLNFYLFSASFSSPLLPSVHRPITFTLFPVILGSRLFALQNSSRGPALGTVHSTLHPNAHCNALQPAAQHATVTRSSTAFDSEPPKPPPKPPGWSTDPTPSTLSLALHACCSSSHSFSSPLLLPFLSLYQGSTAGDLNPLVECHSNNYDFLPILIESTH